jgi:uncharacterized protein (DUF169 family)
MDVQLREAFSNRWRRYFQEADLPITYYYSNDVTREELEDSRSEARCLICNLNRVRDGHTFVYDAKTPGCPGGKRYSGFSHTLRPNFEYFLSCGIPGEMEGERYKKTPELVKEFLKTHPPFEAPAKYLVFKRWDKLSQTDEPLAVVFFATADVLSGLFTLANFDSADPHGVIAPFGAGCSSIVNYPLTESQSDNPKCVLGMFDVSARPCVPDQTLTFTVPMKRFGEMVLNMDESFLTTQSWADVKSRIRPAE